MRWCAGVWTVVGVAVLVACGTSAGRSPSSSSSVSPTGRSPSAAPSGTPSASPVNCASGRVEVTVSPGHAVVQRLCVRPGTVVSLVLEPRVDDKRWRAVRSSAPVFAVVSGWKANTDGTARASVRCAGTRGGTANITATAKAPDLAGAPRVVFTLDLSVVPYTTQG